MVIKKKTEEIWDQVVSTDEEWLEAIAFEGVLLVDVFQKWSGPCTVLAPFFKAVRGEVESKDLKIVAAQADDIEALKFYKGRCVPTFLFFCHGKLREIVRNINWPQINTCLQNAIGLHDSFVHQEIQEIDEIFDPLQQAWLNEQREEYEKKIHQSEKWKQCCLIIFKPDVVQNGKTQEVKTALKEYGFSILDCGRKVLQPEDVEILFEDQVDNEPQEILEEAMSFLTSGPVELAIVTKGATGIDLIDTLLDIVGPEDPEEARRKNPSLLRGIFGSDLVMNAIYVSPDKEIAKRLIAYFFPQFTAPACEEVSVHDMEKTLLIVRPDANKMFANEIINRLQQEGFEVVMSKERVMSTEEVKSFYAEKQNEIFYGELLNNMTSGPLLFLGLARENAVAHMRKILGPEMQSLAKTEQPNSLRAVFAVDTNTVNSLHAPLTVEDAEKELNQFFPYERTLVIIKPNRTARSQKKLIVEKIKSERFKVERAKVKRLNESEATQLYIEKKKEPFYKDLVSFMTRHESIVLILSRQDAVESFKTFAGDKDPEVARKNHPKSLRAMFGEDIMKNSIYRSDSLEEFNAKFPLFFDEVEREASSQSSSLSSVLGTKGTKSTTATGRQQLEGLKSRLSLLNIDWDRDKNTSRSSGTSEDHASGDQSIIREMEMNKDNVEWDHKKAAGAVTDNSVEGNQK